MATTSKDTTAKADSATAKRTDTAAKADDKNTPRVATKTSDKPYGEHAGELAADTRALAEDMQADLDKLTERITDFGDLTPGDTDGATADGVRRLPMAVAEARRAVQALALAAADLTRTATL